MLKRFVFNTGVKPENIHRPLGEYETMELGTLGIEFYCEDVSDSAIFNFASPYGDLQHEGVPFEIVKGGLCSKYTYFLNTKKEELCK